MINELEGCQEKVFEVVENKELYLQEKHGIQEDWGSRVNGSAWG